MSNTQQNEYKKISLVTIPTIDNNNEIKDETYEIDANLFGGEEPDYYKTKQDAVTDKGLTEAKVLASLSQDTNGKISYSTRSLTPGDIGAQPADKYKTEQDIVNSPTTNGSTLEFIDTISQNENGVITATKKNVDLSAYKTHTENEAIFKKLQTKVTSPETNGKTLAFIDTIEQNTNGDITVTKKSVDLGDYKKHTENESIFKKLQEVVSDPTANGTGTSFIHEISQDVNGKITVTKKYIPGISITDDTDAEEPTTDEVAVYKDLTTDGHILTETLVKVPTKGYVDRKISAAVAGAVDYLGIVNNNDELGAAAEKATHGDFVRVATAFGDYHINDLLIYNKPDEETDATWDIIHGEEGDIIEVAAGNGLTGGGVTASVTLSAKAGNHITVDASGIHHNDKPTTTTEGVAAHTTIAGSGRTYVTEVLVDGYGHVAGIKTASETNQTINDGKLVLKASDGVTATEQEFTADYAGNDITFEVKHAEPTGAAAGSTTPNAAQTPDYGATFNIPVITTDKFGHVTEKSTTTVKIPDKFDISGKADKVSGATSGNFAGLDANGNLTDSGKNASSFATSAQGQTADSALQSVVVLGSTLNKNSNTLTVADAKTALGLGSAAYADDYIRVELNDNKKTLDDNVVTLITNSPHKVVFYRGSIQYYPENLSSASALYYTSQNMIFKDNNLRIEKHIITINTNAKTWGYSSFTYDPPSYGTITPVNSNSTDEVQENTTPINAATNKDEVNFKAGNKWIKLAGAEGGKDSNDSITFGHALSGATADTYGPGSDVNGANGATITVPQITIDAAGHITGVAEKTFTAVDTTYTAGTGLDLNANEFSLEDSYGDNKNPYGGKAANRVLAGPASGESAAPSFRGLVEADIPNLSSSKITTMTGYSKPSTTNAIATTDTLNAAIGKLEKALDGKVDLSGNGSQTITKPTIFSGSEVFQINIGGKDQHDSWFLFTDELKKDNGTSVAFGVRRPYDSYGFQIRDRRPKDGGGYNDKYYNIIKAEDVSSVEQDIIPVFVNKGTIVASTKKLADFQPINTNLTSIASIDGEGFLKKGENNTWSIDTNTYLTSEQDTLSTVVSRGTSTDSAITTGGFIHKDLITNGNDYVLLGGGGSKLITQLSVASATDATKLDGKSSSDYSLAPTENTTSNIVLVGIDQTAKGNTTYHTTDIVAYPTGQLKAKTFSVDGKATIQYNEDCIDFIFI